MDIIIGIICGFAMLGMLVFYNIGYNNGYSKGRLDTIEHILKEMEKAKKQKKTPKNKK